MPVTRRSFLQHVARALTVYLPLAVASPRTVSAEAGHTIAAETVPTDGSAPEYGWVPEEASTDRASHAHGSSELHPSPDRTAGRPSASMRTAAATRRFTPRWLKGNTHTHRSYSDGDSPPEVVVDWYGANGYDFLFLTDHNVLIPDDHLARRQRREMLVFQGEEVTLARAHINGLGTPTSVGPSWLARLKVDQLSATTSENIRWAVDRILAQGAVAILAHPNLGWGITSTDLLEAGEIGMLEVANGHPAA